MLELSDKDVKEAIIKMFQWAIMNMLETNEKIENLSKEIEVIKKNKMLDYRKLPIKEKTPLFAPEEFNDYIPSNLYHQLYISDSHEFIDHPGKYKITCKKRKNVVVSSIVIYDEELMKLLLFYCVDYE